MSYEIVITKTEVQEVESGCDWTIIEKRPLTSEENRETFKPDPSQIKTVYGYTPKIVKSEAVTTEIYRQTIPELDLPVVIIAVNKLD